MDLYTTEMAMEHRLTPTLSEEINKSFYFEQFLR